MPTDTSAKNAAIPIGPKARAPAILPITNAVRHARRARRVVVRVQSAGDSVRITVTDDGDGSEADGGQGYGLLGMAERTHLLGGHFEAGPVRPRGWRVSAELPRAAVAA